MCGRVTLSRFDAEAVARFLQVAAIVRFNPRFNIAPTQNLLALRNSDTGKRETKAMHWGIPTRFDPALINVRSETAMVKKAFKDSFLHRQCLIAVDGFYEWQKIGRTRQAHHITLKDRGLYALGAIWQGPDVMHDPTVDSCAILTVPANSVVAPLHNRMPLIIDPQDHATWLDGKTPIEDIEALLCPFSDDQMMTYAVGQWVNNARNEGPKCLEPAAPVAPQKTLFD